MLDQYLMQNELLQRQVVREHEEIIPADADSPTRQDYVLSTRVASQSIAGVTRTVIFDLQLETRADAVRTAAEAYSSSWTRPRPIPGPQNQSTTGNRACFYGESAKCGPQTSLHPTFLACTREC